MKDEDITVTVSNIVVDDICSMVETPTRTYRLTDSEGKAPPLVPTVDAVKVWGEWWWGSDCGVSKIVRVEVDARGALRVWFPGWELEETVGASAPWLGPVTERPKETP